MLSHELGHLKCDHGLWLTVANVLASGTVTVLPVVTGMVEEALMRYGAACGVVMRIMEEALMRCGAACGDGDGGGGPDEVHEVRSSGEGRGSGEGWGG